jgi:hypothetical protein
MSLLHSETEYELESGPSGRSLARDSELLFNSLAAMADRGGSSQALRRVALDAARAALRGATRPAPAIEGELGEFEAISELEHESSATTLQELEAELEHLAHAAAEAESEHEAAEQFLPLIPLAARLAMPLVRRALPAAARALSRSAPRVIRQLTPSLSRGVNTLARTLHRNRSTRPLLRAVPRIAATTMQSIGARLARGQRISPRLAAQILARQTTRTLGTPRQLHRCLRHSVAADRRYHQHNPGAVSALPRTTQYASGRTIVQRRPVAAVPSRSGALRRMGSCRRVVICDNCASRR